MGRKSKVEESVLDLLEQTHKENAEAVDEIYHLEDKIHKTNLTISSIKAAIKIRNEMIRKLIEVLPESKGENKGEQNDTKQVHGNE